ncbi:pectinesterase family protein [Paenibacillus thailandensis]|uniref:Pectinesterase family protein n=2 Tax=Paenibacillus thailandensis TaxID=393250 RepID=A0ABW5QXQ9_9BACL
MKKRLIQMLVTVMLCSSFGGTADAADAPAANAAEPSVASAASGQIPAFPGAQGGGMYASGGRGGEVYEVTTLADSGPGSLRDAVSGSNRTVVFKVGGTIKLESPLKITGSNLTIAGQTAPGEGITVTGYPVTFDASNLIIRYMRFRLGDANPTEADAFGGRYQNNIIIDHSSFSWSVDEVMSNYGNENVTVQWSIIAEAMHLSRHVKGKHGYGGIWGGKNTSFHHNLIAHNSSRNPAFDSTAGNSHDFRNNVIYNWGYFSAYGGKGAVTNIVNNYYKPGPETENIRFLNAETNGSYFIDGNVMEGYSGFTADNWEGVYKYPDYIKLVTEVAFPNPVATESAEEAYAAVLEGAGANLPKRDAVDAKIVSDVINRTGTHINSQNEVGGYPEFEQAVSAQADDDHDGMPDEWELRQGLNPNDPEDRNGTNNEGYTNLEVYLNSIVGNGSANPSVAVTSPANNAILEAGSDVMLEAAATDSDGAVAKVEFYASGEKLGEDRTAPYQFRWEDVPDGTHYVVAKAVDDTGTSTRSPNVAVHANTVSDISPWSSSDVGAPGIPGHTQAGDRPGEMTVKSSGDIEGAADAFHFAYRQMSGNAEIVARVESVTATNEGAEAGVMFRESLEADSPFASLMVPFIRTGKRGVTLSRAVEGGEVSGIQPEEEFQLPYWVKLVRLGDRFTSFVSPDGLRWKTVGSVQVDMSDSVYVGLAADAAKPDNEVDKYNTSSFSNVSVTQLAEDYPTPPENVEAESGELQTVVTWESVPAADGYNVKSSLTPGGPYETVAEGITGTSFIHTGLTAGMTYYYVVTAVNEHGESFDSAEAGATPTGGQGTLYYINDDYESLETGVTPEGYAITPSPQDIDHTVAVAPVPSDSIGNASNKALHVYDNGVGNTLFALAFPKQTGTVVIETDFMSPSLPGTSVLLQVKDPEGTKTPIAVEVRKPQLPEAEDTYTLVYKNKNGQDVKLVDAPANNRWHNLKIVASAASNRMDIYVNNALAAEQVELRDDMRTLGLGSALFGRTPGTGRGTFYFDNVKIYVEPVASPKGVSAIPGNGKVQLNWNTASGASSYTVKRSLTEGGPYETIASGIDAATTTYTDTTVENETTYYYVVIAVGERGESGPSNQVIVTPSANAVKPAAPAGLSGSGRNTQVDLAWQPVDNAVTYTVKRKSGSSETPYETVDVVDKPFFRDTGLTNGTMYTYVVSATSVAGEGEDSEPINVRPVAPLQSPRDVEAGAGDGTAVVSWSAPTGATSYQLKRSTDIGGPYEVVAGGLTGTDYTDTGLNNGTAYYYVVSAHNDTSSSANSEPVRVLPYPAGSAPAPSDVRLTARENEVEISWQDVAEAASYTVKRSESRDGSFTVVASDLKKNRFTDPDVETGKTYYYSVYSVNDNGEGVGSFPLGATPASVIVVAKDGSADFTTVQAAIDAIPEGNTARTVIYIRDGTYEEQIRVPKTKRAISFVGESKENTILTYTGITGTGFNETATFVESDDFTAENITFANGAGSQGAANALDVSGDRAYFNNVRMLGYQDTLLVHDAGDRIYVKNSYIEGAVDFIYGPAIAVFDSSVIHNVRSGGYVTAASTPDNQEYGYLFVNSKITGEEGLSDVYLGRPWRPFAHVVFMNSELDPLVHRAGWHNWGRPSNEETAKYYEFNNFGPGADPADRAAWSKQLTPEEASAYTVHRMMRGADGWDPTAMPVLPDVKSAGIPVSSVTVVSGNGNMTINKLGATLQLSAQIEPENATNKAVEWNVFDSDGETISDKASVDNSGVLTALEEGVVTVKATAKDGSNVSGEAKITIDATAPVIQVSVLEDVYSSVDWIPDIELSDEISGIDDSKTVVTLDGIELPLGEAVALYDLPLGSHTLVVSATDFAGNTETVTVHFRTVTSIGNLAALVERFARTGDIDNAGIAYSLSKKLEQENLTSFANEVRAQKGKHISAYAAEILLRNADEIAH